MRIYWITCKIIGRIIPKKWRRYWAMEQVRDDGLMMIDIKGCDAVLVVGAECKKLSIRYNLDSVAYAQTGDVVRLHLSPTHKDADLYLKGIE